MSVAYSKLQPTRRKAESNVKMGRGISRANLQRRPLVGLVGGLQQKHQMNSIAQPNATRRLVGRYQFCQVGSSGGGVDILPLIEEIGQINNYIGNTPPLDQPFYFIPYFYKFLKDNKNHTFIIIRYASISIFAILASRVTKYSLASGSCDSTSSCLPYSLYYYYYSIQ